MALSVFEVHAFEAHERAQLVVRTRHRKPDPRDEADRGKHGNEGVVGVSLFMGGESTPSRAVVQSAGYGWRLKSLAMKDEFNRAGPAMHLLLRYTRR